MTTTMMHRLPDEITARDDEGTRLNENYRVNGLYQIFPQSHSKLNETKEQKGCLLGSFFAVVC